MIQYHELLLYLITDFYWIHDRSGMRNMSVSTWIGATYMPVSAFSYSLAKENVARIMYTLLLRSHWIMLPKAEFICMVVRLCGGADR